MDGRRPAAVDFRIGLDDANAGTCRDAHSRAQASTVRYELSKTA
jgi:hypothetical protein